MCQEFCSQGRVHPLTRHWTQMQPPPMDTYSPGHPQPMVNKQSECILLECYLVGHLITTCKQSLQRLCFHRCLSVHRGNAWQGQVWQGESVYGRAHVWWEAFVPGGHAWQGGRMAWDMHDQGGRMAGEMATAAGGIHPTGMHSCSTNLARMYNMIPGMKYTNRRIQHHNKTRQSVRKSVITPTTTPTMIHLSETHKYICLTSLTRAKCGTRSTLCWKIRNISGSIELFAL